jgi:hypothetical protein
MFILILLLPEAEAGEILEPPFGHPAALDRILLSPEKQKLSKNLDATPEF